jgi:hypothetical protein
MEVASFFIFYLRDHIEPVEVHKKVKNKKDIAYSPTLVVTPKIMAMSKFNSNEKIQLAITMIKLNIEVYILI